MSPRSVGTRKCTKGVAGRGSLGRGVGSVHNREGGATVGLHFEKADLPLFVEIGELLCLSRCRVEQLVWEARRFWSSYDSG